MIRDTRTYIELAKLYLEEDKKEEVIECLDLALAASYKKKTVRRMSRKNCDRIVYYPRNAR
jgi:hypothetical protein